MGAGSIVVLLSGVACLFAAAVVAAGALLVWYGISRLQPVHELEARTIRLQALVDALEGQVNKLRTSKAGRISNAKRATEAASEPIPPEYEGLTEEEISLFR